MKQKDRLQITYKLLNNYNDRMLKCIEHFELIFWNYGIYIDDLKEAHLNQILAMYFTDEEGYAIKEIKQEQQLYFECKSENKRWVSSRKMINDALSFFGVQK